LKQGNSVATALREEHLKNLDTLRMALGAQLAKRNFVVKRNSQADAEKAILFEVPGACTMDMADPYLYLRRRLFSSYVSMEMTHIQNRLRHPAYRRKYVETANTDIARLANLDLSCLSSYPPSDLIYAQILDTYALNTVQYVAAKKDSISSDEKKKRFDTAEQAIRFGLEITDKQTQLDLNRRGVPFLKRIAPSDWVSTHESLEQTRNKLQSAMED
jgi:hypothetical protein